MDAPDAHAQTGDHDALVSAIVSQVQALALASDRIGGAFAALHRLHTTDFRALTAIHRAERDGQPLTARQLADALQLSPGAVTYLVDRLAASDHVYRDGDPTDRRRVLLRVGDHGRRVAAEFFGPLGLAHTGAMASYSDEELGICLRFLVDVNRSLATFDADLRQPE